MPLNRREQLDLSNLTPKITTLTDIESVTVNDSVANMPDISEFHSREVHVEEVECSRFRVELHFLGCVYLQAISTGRRGLNVSNADQSTAQGIKQKGNRKAHHAEHPSLKAGGSVAPSSSAEVATSEEGPGSTPPTVEPTSTPASGGIEAGTKHAPGNGGNNERNRGNHWRGGQDNGGFGRPRNGRDQVRSNNQSWNQRGFRMNNGPAATLRTGSNRNYSNRNMFNNNMSEFGNPAGVIHVPGMLLILCLSKSHMTYCQMGVWFLAVLHQYQSLIDPVVERVTAIC